MAELAIPKRFKAVDGDANEYHRGTGKDVVKIRKTSKAGFHSCSGRDCNWFITIRKGKCPVCDTTQRSGSALKSVSKEDIHIIAKLTKDVIEGKTTEKPKGSEPTPEQVLDVMMGGSEDAKNEMIENVNAWKNYKLHKSIGDGRIKKYTKEIKVALEIKDEDSEEAK